MNQNVNSRVTKKLTQFFFHDVLEDDRNRLAENLVVGPSSSMFFFPFLIAIFKLNT